MNSKLRQQVLERDNHTCQECGQKLKRLETHHILARRYGGTDDLDNIITLCHKCHTTIEPSRKMGPITSKDYVEVKGKSIRLTQSIYNTLSKRVLFYGDTMSDIIIRLLDELDDCRRRNKK